MHERARAADSTGLTVIIPAYNEADSIVDTIRSLQQQSRVPDEILAIDD